MVREPSWHRLENAVLKESPRTWGEAREQAGLTWDVGTEMVYVMDDQMVPTPVKGFQAIYRDDKSFDDPGWLLSVQQDSYKVIPNETFGDVIDAVLGRQGAVHLPPDTGQPINYQVLDEEDPLNFEALMSLYGGRMIVALMRFEKPLVMGWDNSENYPFLCLASRHDGQGGLRGMPTVVRVQCANTFNAAEAMDTRGLGFTIRHTSNWESRLAEVSRGIIAARGDSARWVKFAEQLALFEVNARTRERYLKSYLPASDDMGSRMRDNVMLARTKIRNILDSKTCEHIKDNGYGLLMASTEYSDHFRGVQSPDSYVSRQLLHKEEPKARAARILRKMAGIKV